MPEPIEIPLPDPLGLLEGEARAVGAPVIPIDPLATMGKRWVEKWLIGMRASREKAVFEYARSLQESQWPHDPGTRMRAIDNYRKALERGLRGLG